MIRSLVLLTALLAALPACGEERFDRLSEAARSGSPADQLALAALLDAGLGVPRDRDEAFLWYSRAALGGEPRAQHTLGQIFETGDGVPRNVALARAWYAAAQDVVPAAAERLEALEPVPATTPAAPEIRAARRLGDGGVEVIWAAPEQPPNARFLLQGRLPDRTILLGETGLSAVRQPNAGGVEPCCLRVVALDPDGARYAASDWVSPDETSEGAQAGPVHVVLVHAGGAAPLLAEDLKQDFEASGVPVSIRRALEPVRGSGIAFFYEDDRLAAETVATLLPRGFGTPKLRRADPEAAPPGLVEIHLNGPAGAK